MSFPLFENEQTKEGLIIPWQKTFNDFRFKA